MANMKSSLFFCLIFVGFCSAVIFPTILFIEEHCIAEGNADLWKAYKTLLANANRCHARGYISLLLQPQAATVQYRTNSTVHEQVEFLHSLVDDALKCNEDVNKFGFDCLPPDGRDYVNRTEAAYYRIKEYMFGKNDEKSIDFIRNGGVECLVKEKIVNSCYRPSLVLLDSISVAESEKKIEKYYITEKTCIEKLMQEHCPKATTYISDVIDIARSALRPSKNVLLAQNDAQPSIFESSKYGIMSVCPSSKRLVREIGGGDSKLPHIENRLRYMCSYSTELDDSIESMKKCLRLKPIFETRKKEYIQHVDQCSQETRKILKKCLPEKQRYFPDFFFDLVESVLGLLYDDFGEIARGLSPCLSKLKTAESEEDYKDCIAKTGAKFDDSALDSKASFCSKFIAISKCFIKQLNDTCTPNDDLEKFKKDYITAMEKPCK